jgi:hypothetical protein
LIFFYFVDVEGYLPPSSISALLVLSGKQNISKAQPNFASLIPSLKVGSTVQKRESMIEK